MTLKLVLFDLDGTLLDTAADFTTVLHKLQKEENQALVSEAQIRATVSSGARALVQLGFEIEDSHKEFERLRLRLLELYSQHLSEQTSPFDGILETLEFTHRNSLRWGIVTNKPDIYTQPLINALVEDKRLPYAPHTVICPDHVKHRKPHPESLLLACKQLESTPNETIYLGDHRRDIECGHNAGIKTIACNYGYIEEGDPIESWQATHQVEHAREIPAILEQYL